MQDDELIERIAQYVPNKVLAKNLSLLFDEYEQNGFSAKESADEMDFDEVLGDSTLTYDELKARLIETLQQSGFYSKKGMILENANRIEQEQHLLKTAETMKKEENEILEDEAAKAKFDKAVAEIENSSDDNLESSICKLVPEMKKLHDFLDLTLEGSKYINGLLVVGPAGVRKTFLIMNELDNRKLPYSLATSHASALGLYELLFRNLDGIVVLDDLETLLEDRKALAVLKAAVFGSAGKRMVTWHSTANALKERHLPSEFEFCGKLIIIANDMPSSRLESFKAFLGRFYVHHMKFTDNTRRILVRSVIMKQDVFGLSVEKKRELLEYMEGLLDYSKIDQYNLRTAMKACEIWKLKGEDGKDLIAELLGTDERIRKFLLIEDRAKHLPVGKRVSVWKNYTGYSQSTYHLIKSRYYSDKYDGIARMEKELEELDELIENER